MSISNSTPSVVNNTIRKVCAAISILCSAYLTGCVGPAIYQSEHGAPIPDDLAKFIKSPETKDFPKREKGLTPEDEEFLAKPFAVEFDDEGDFWSRSGDTDLCQFERARGALRLAKMGGRAVTLLLYVHGWKHSADAGKSGNFAHFTKVIRELNDGAVDGRLYVGVYIGWRGYTWPPLHGLATHNPVGLANAIPLNLSFWNRLRAADRVARTSATYAILSLAAEAKRSDFGPTQTGKDYVVMVGHSMGGRIVERAVAQAMVGGLMVRAPDLRFEREAIQLQGTDLNLRSGVVEEQILLMSGESEPLKDEVDRAHVALKEAELAQATAEATLERTKRDRLASERGVFNEIWQKLRSFSSWIGIDTEMPDDASPEERLAEAKRQLSIAQQRLIEELSKESEREHTRSIAQLKKATQEYVVLEESVKSEAKSTKALPKRINPFRKGQGAESVTVNGLQKIVAQISAAKSRAESITREMESHSTQGLGIELKASLDEIYRLQEACLAAELDSQKKIAAEKEHELSVAAARQQSIAAKQLAENATSNFEKAAGQQRALSDERDRLIAERSRLAQRLARLESRPADLIILINPASESLIGRQVSEALRDPWVAESIGSQQAPWIISVSSSKDWATRIAYPWGARLSRPLSRFRSEKVHGDQGLYFRTPGPHNPHFRTHTIEPVNFEGKTVAKGTNMKSRFNRSALLDLNLNTDGKLDSWLTQSGLTGVKDAIITEDGVFALKPVLRNSPESASDKSIVPGYWAILADPSLIKDHNDVFEERTIALTAALLRLSQALPQSAPPARSDSKDKMVDTGENETTNITAHYSR